MESSGKSRMACHSAWREYSFTRDLSGVYRFTLTAMGQSNDGSDLYVVLADAKALCGPPALAN